MLKTPDELILIMKISETLYIVNGEQWRDWLAKNHSTANAIWLIYYKKDSGKLRIPYNAAVDEALCYGWIDSTNKLLTKIIMQRDLVRVEKIVNYPK
jgi:uncharacterized protein YdeI (YjbR/CyaY-like superfamily)